MSRSNINLAHFDEDTLLCAYGECDYIDDDNMNDFVLDFIVLELRELSSSFESVYDFVNNEYCVLDNDLVDVYLDFYGEKYVVYIKSNSEHEGLAVAFCKRIRDKFMQKFSTLKYIGSFSSGEAIFERINNN